MQGKIGYCCIKKVDDGEIEIPFVITLSLSLPSASNFNKISKYKTCVSLCDVFDFQLIGLLQIQKKKKTNTINRRRNGIDYCY
jgi:hypothetical protein